MKPDVEEFIQYQEERAQRREEATKIGGDNYGRKTVVNLNGVNIDAARKLAESYFEPTPDKGLRGFLARRRIEKIAGRLCSMAELVPTGNVELRDIDIESGLFEPYNPRHDTFEKWRIAKIVASTILAEQKLSMEPQA